MLAALSLLEGKQNNNGNHRHDPQHLSQDGLNSFYTSYFFLLINVHSKPVAQAGQHSRGRRAPGGCAANTATLGARGQAPTQ